METTAPGGPQHRPGAVVAAVLGAAALVGGAVLVGTQVLGDDDGAGSAADATVHVTTTLDPAPAASTMPSTPSTQASSTSAGPTTAVAPLPTAAAGSPTVATPTPVATPATTVVTVTATQPAPQATTTTVVRPTAATSTTLRPGDPGQTGPGGCNLEGIPDEVLLTELAGPGWATVLASYPKKGQNFSVAACRSQALGATMADSDETPGMTPGYWAVVDPTVRASKSEASAACARYGRSPGPTCYARQIG